MKKKIENRYLFIYWMFLSVFLVIFFRLSYLTIVKGDKYLQEAQNKVYRNISIEAPRGEIRDRYGRLLAGNRSSFSVTISKNQIKKGMENEVSLKLMNILIDNEEKCIDEFPLKKENGEFYFTFDKKINDWKNGFEIPSNLNAKDSFYYLANRLVDEGLLTENDLLEDKFILQKRVNQAGYYPPISAKKWEFIEDMKKNAWLGKYKITNVDEKPDEVYLKILDYFKIDKSLAYEDINKILIIRDRLRLTGYLQYQPIKVATDVSKKTVAQISEHMLDLSGVEIRIDPIRYYPNSNLAAHVIGQIGKISRDYEIEKYTRNEDYKDKYDLSDYIGKTGIEKSFEDRLHGVKGYKKVQVDASGRLIKEIERKSPVSGDTLYLTIDMDLQKATENSLENVLRTLQKGQVYKSPYGDVRLRDSRRIFKNATSGAAVALDVKTGEVLALASYPNYDPNIFVNDISNEDMKKLLPNNMNDPLAPRPLYNIATMTHVQPGSVFKMITGAAAMEAGLSPFYEIQDKGYIELGNRTFGCWLWNDRRAFHGSENLIKAIEDSCNYYFYCISDGYDYAKDKKLPVDVSIDNVIDMAKLFGLNEKTGIEIEESIGEVPDEESKLRITKRSLKYKLNDLLKEYFKDINYKSEKYKERIELIVSWTEENPSRGEIIKRLSSLNIKEEKITEVTDLIKYSYFNRAKWKTGDKFNLAIGQGENSYTPLQIARYIAILANDGYINDVTLVGKAKDSSTGEVFINNNEKTELDLKSKDKLKYIREGMLKVSEEGTAKSLFKNFPVRIAGKTGTAQKSGWIPKVDEKKYYLSVLKYFGLNEEEVLNVSSEIAKKDDNKKSEVYYIKKAIFKLKPNLTINDLNAYKENYDNFAWFSCFAPYDDPQIAVVVLIFNGGHGSYSGVIARDIIGAYMGINEETQNQKELILNNRLMP
ncbi:MAG: penicillin-binding transpeptidase domain-containing protein [Peptostreptococcaceae bacterium]|jgi:penicillin-binding protein 2|nr:penicillin-binding transpeptidase domain-containing protein [Peptostreptococcaceae bacterium]